MMLCKRRRDKMDVRDELGLDLCKGGKSGQVSSHSIDQVLKRKRRIGHTGDDSWRDEEELENGALPSSSPLFSVPSLPLLTLLVGRDQDSTQSPERTKEDRSSLQSRGDVFKL
jgi:hypothetical protein